MAKEEDNSKLRKFDKPIIAMVAALFTFPIASRIVQNKVGGDVKQYVESNLGNIIKEQEEKLGIKHFGVPNISYDPAVVYDIGLSVQGIYTPERDEIFLQLGSAVTPEENLTNTLARFFGMGYTYNIKKVLDHELGHFYLDKLNESRGLGDWPTTLDLLIKPGTRVIAEGIAEYFKKTINGEPDNFTDAEWPKTIFDWTMMDVYKCGCHLVKPIIEKYGQKGIEYLIDNPPTLKDFENMPAYQNKILENLANPTANQELYEGQEIQEKAIQ